MGNYPIIQYKMLFNLDLMFIGTKQILTNLLTTNAPIKIKIKLPNMKMHFSLVESFQTLYTT